MKAEVIESIKEMQNGPSKPPTQGARRPPWDRNRGDVPTQRSFYGYCDWCEKQGHRWRDCRELQQLVRGARRQRGHRPAAGKRIAPPQ
mmetsp:Transcript_37281/g.106659  ORF Transcript_37281/g.106659 Transcript_37281/m.106659 type:complete len:88 (+) Transcript_37281:968-1231(+)